MILFIIFIKLLGIVNIIASDNETLSTYVRGIIFNMNYFNGLFCQYFLYLHVYGLLI